MNIRVNEIYCPIILKATAGGINIYGNPCEVLYVSESSVLLKSVADSELIYGQENLVALDKFKSDWKSKAAIDAEKAELKAKSIDFSSTNNKPVKIGYNRYRLNNGVEISFDDMGHVSYHYEVGKSGIRNPIPSFYMTWIARESARLLALPKYDSFKNFSYSTYNSPRGHNWWPIFRD